VTLLATTIFRHFAVRLWTITIIGISAWLSALSIIWLSSVMDHPVVNFAANLTLKAMAFGFPMLMAAIAIGWLDRINPFYSLWDAFQGRNTSFK
jgi:hypothetical protein